MAEPRVKSVLIVGGRYPVVDELEAALGRRGWIYRRSRDPDETVAFLREIRPAVVLACAQDDEQTAAVVQRIRGSRFADGIPIAAVSSTSLSGAPTEWPVEDLIPDACGIDQMLDRLDALVSAGRLQ